MAGRNQIAVPFRVCMAGQIYRFKCWKLCAAASSLHVIGLRLQNRLLLGRYHSATPHRAGDAK